MRRVAILAAAAVACAHGPPARVSDEWPAEAPKYGDAQRRSTRHAELWHDFGLGLDVYATLKTPEWRAAYVATETKRAGLGALDAERLLTAERTAAGEVWEVELIVATGRPDWNDLASGERSMW